MTLSGSMPDANRIPRVAGGVTIETSNFVRGVWSGTYTCDNAWGTYWLSTAPRDSTIFPYGISNVFEVMRAQYETRNPNDLPAYPVESIIFGVAISCVFVILIRKRSS